MNALMKVVGATALLAGSGFASMALADAGTMTCGEFMAMDDAGKLVAGHDMLLWIADTANFAVVGPLQGYFVLAPIVAGTTADAKPATPTDGWSDPEMMIEIEAHCFHVPADSTVLDRLKSHT